MADDGKIADREKTILSAIITRHIYTGEPVSSTTISEMQILSLSPATIRNIMADIEDMGYLMQPHTSAGRIPTDKGFRFYVDSILKIKELPATEKEKIKVRCNGVEDIEKVMRNTSDILSAMSKCMGVVLAPRFENFFIKRMEFIKLGERKIMILLVSSAGIVQNRIITIEEDLGQRDIEKMSAYLNEIASGLTLGQLKAKILEEMKEEKNLYDQLMAKALQLSSVALDEDENGENVYVDGKINILNQPEFIKDAERMRLLFEAFEEKSVLVKILDKAMQAKGIQVFIGSENGINEVKWCSIVSAPYRSGGNVLGTLAVIGPIRMNYSRVIPLVNYTAGLLSDIMERRETV